MNILQTNPLLLLFLWSLLFLALWYARQNWPILLSLLLSAVFLVLLFSPNGKTVASWTQAVPDLDQRLSCLGKALPEAAPWKDPRKPAECIYLGRPL